MSATISDLHGATTTMPHGSIAFTGAQGRGKDREKWPETIWRRLATLSQPTIPQAKRLRLVHLLSFQPAGEPSLTSPFSATQVTWSAPQLAAGQAGG
ncbi:MAG: hypothetical protein FKY71_16910 [Spiribacter salinus]|uniref:Uncharacterized protein n=1 Tax=Spiribacter salinus TaxID=1335746 RepID=A0A540VGL8_9GAMM|nr:MAG: hypothetical protein FKY71_16910 [Spiribacter salinus]